MKDFRAATKRTPPKRKMRRGPVTPVPGSCIRHEADLFLPWLAAMGDSSTFARGLSRA